MSSRRISTAPKQTAGKPSLKQRAAQTRDAAGRFIKGNAKQPAQPEVAVAPLGTVAVPPGTHPDAYGLVVDETGLGLHAAPGAHVIVEPVMPAKAGLAVFYMKDAHGPTIFDLTRNFRPEFAGPFAPESEVMPLIEVCVPATGQIGHLRADHVATIHKVRGVLTPAEIMSQHRPAPAALPEMAECPEGMGTYLVEDAVAYPLVRPGETVVYDGMQREPTNGALCVLQWNSGTRVALQTNRGPVGGWDEEAWFAAPVNRPSSRAMLERRLASGSPGPLYASDGPYTEAHLRERIVGTVVGILVSPVRRQRTSPPAVSSHDIAIEAASAAVKVASDLIGDALTDINLSSELSDEMCAAIEDHAEALAVWRTDSDDTDETFHRRAARQQETDDTLRGTAIRSLADLRAKLTYLVPLMAPDMLDQTHVAHLKVIRDDVDRLCRVPAMDEGSTDPVFEAIQAQRAAWDTFGQTVNLTDKAWRLEQGLDASDEAMAPAEAAWEATHKAEIAAWNAVFETRPTTLPGFVAMIRHAQRWASSHDGMNGCLDTDEVLQRITIDAERVLWAALDGHGDDRPNLSKVPAAELAAMSFEPIDRSTSPCPVPSREAWIKDADMVLPWLRMGWLYLSLDRDELADAMLAEEEQHADDFNHSLRAAAHNFDQLARFARAVLDRRLIGIATLAVREGAVDEDGGV